MSTVAEQIRSAKSERIQTRNDSRETVNYKLFNLLRENLCVRQKNQQSTNQQSTNILNNIPIYHTLIGITVCYNIIHDHYTSNWQIRL